MPATDFVSILRTLTAHAVDFIVVGGVSAVLNGAPITTLDLDVVHARNEKNVERLLAALVELEARYRTQPQKSLQPAASHLASSGHQLLTTRYGPLNLHSHTFDVLFHDTTEMDIGQNTRVRVLNVARLIAVKSETADEKDRAVLPILRRTLEQQT